MARAARGVVLGIRVRTARAIGVVIGGDARSPEALRRDELRLWDPAVPESRQPWHAALGLEGAAARRVVERASGAVRKSALGALRGLAGELRRAGLEPGRVALVVASDTDPSTIRSAHTHAHAAEGRLFREALEQAAEACGLPHRTFVERKLRETAASVLGVGEADLKRALAELGRPLGRPWRADEKSASLAAWLELSGR